MVTDLRDNKYQTRKVATLLQRHDDYNRKLSSWNVLSDIHHGTAQVMSNIQKYILPKPNEDATVYDARLRNASYTPILANTFRETINKLCSAPVHVKGGDTPYWLKVRQALDGDTQDEKDFIELIFTHLLYYGVFYAVTYRPTIPLQPSNSAEDEQVLSAGYQSRVKVLHPLNVINHGSDWVITQDIYKDVQPLEDAKLRVRWTLYAPYVSWEYDAECQTDKGKLMSIMVDGRWASVLEPDLTITGTSTLHGLERCPVVTSTLEAHHWAGDLAYQQQLRHLRIESQLNETGSIAGSVVRLFTPSQPKEENANTLLRKDKHEENKALKMPGAYTLVGDNYRFVESTGAAISGLLDLLDKIERYIRAVGSLDFKSSDAKHQSAESKETDMSMLENEMMFLGSKAIKIYQDVIDRIADLDNQQRPVVEGLQNYGINNISVMLKQSVVMESVGERLPPVALRLWYTRLATLMTGQTFGEVETQLQDEVEEIYSKPLKFPLIEPPKPPTVSAKVTDI